MRYRDQKGHVAVEWVAVTFILVMILFAPVFNDNQSIVGIAMDSIRDFNRSTSFLYSLP